MAACIRRLTTISGGSRPFSRSACWIRRWWNEAQSAQFPIDTARNLSYGFGWFVAGSGDSRLVYHTGSNGGFRTIVLTKPSAKYAVVIFSNRTGVDLEDLVRIINRIYAIDDKTFVKLETLIS